MDDNMMSNALHQLNSIRTWLFKLDRTGRIVLSITIFYWLSFALDLSITLIGTALRSYIREGNPLGFFPGLIMFFIITPFNILLLHFAELRTSRILIFLIEFLTFSVALMHLDAAIDNFQLIARLLS